jgi:arylsulfatase A-like enzyme
VLAEDFPAWTLGCYGNTEVRTPNLDALARAGTRFTNNLAYTPVASESRASLLSGSPKGGRALAELLQGAGYRCGAFDQTCAALDFIQQQTAGNPFFVHVNLPGATAATTEFLDSYAGVPFAEQGLMQAVPRAAQGKENFADLIGSFRKAAAAISACDAQFALIRKKLMERGFFDNTLVIFLSTNGLLLGRHGLWGDARASEPENLYEEVVRAPMIWSWPGRVPVQVVRPELVSAYDFVPTLCEIAGAEAPAGLCGRSYFAVAASRALPKGETWRDLGFAHYRSTWMARDNRFKVVLRDGDAAAGELYDLRQDPGEFTNG